MATTINISIEVPEAPEGKTYEWRKLYEALDACVSLPEAYRVADKHELINARNYAASVLKARAKSAQQELDTVPENLR